MPDRQSRALLGMFSLRIIQVEGDLPGGPSVNMRLLVPRVNLELKTYCVWGASPP